MEVWLVAFLLITVCLWLDTGKKVKHIGEKVGKVGMATGVDGIHETNYGGYSGYGYTFCDDTQ